MKAYPFEEKRLAKWQPPFIVQPKYDGIRCRAVPLESGEFVLLSSEENIIYSVPHINTELNHFMPRVEWDGELYSHKLPFEQITSITSRTVNIHPDHEAIKFHIFDIVKEGISQHSRLAELVGYKYRFKESSFLEMAPYWLCDNLEEIMRAYDKLIELGYEGIIVRHCQAPYERKRSLYVMKFKGKKEDDYKIIGYKEEFTVNGIPKNTLGALQCESGDGNTFFVGTGFTDESRELLWKEKETLIGKTAKVKYQHLTSGNKVPRFPVFTEITND